MCIATQPKVIFEKENLFEFIGDQTNQPSRVKVQCSAYDAGKTVLEGHNDRLDPNYTVHLLMLAHESHKLCGKKENYWMDTEVAAVYYNGNPAGLAYDLIAFLENDLNTWGRQQALLESGEGEASHLEIEHTYKTCRFNNLTLLGDVEPCWITTTINYHTAGVKGGNVEVAYPEVVSICVWEETPNASPALMQAMQEAVAYDPDVLKSGVPADVLEIVSRDHSQCGPIIPIARNAVQPINPQKPTIDVIPIVESASYGRVIESSDGAIEETTVRVGCVIVDASTTPLYINKRGDQLDSRYALHLLILSDTRNEIGGKFWTDLRVLKVTLDGKEIKRKANGSFNKDVTAVLKGDLKSAERRYQLLKTCRADYDAPYVRQYQPVEFISVRQINESKVRLETVVNFYHVDAPGVPAIKYPEVVWVFANGESLVCPDVMSGKLHRALFEQLLDDDKALLSGMSQPALDAVEEMLYPKPKESRTVAIGKKTQSALAA